MQSDHDIVTIKEQPVELCKLLKIANMVGGGGEAKIVISEGYVMLNGEVEYRKRKKVMAGDLIEFNGETVSVVLDKAVNTDSPKTIKAQKKAPSGKAAKPEKQTKKQTSSSTSQAPPPVTTWVTLNSDSS